MNGPTGGNGATAPMLDVPTVAKRIGTSDKTVRREINRGELPVHRIGRLLRISEDDLAAYLRARRRMAGGAS